MCCSLSLFVSLLCVFVSCVDMSLLYLSFFVFLFHVFENNDLNKTNNYKEQHNSRNNNINKGVLFKGCLCRCVTICLQNTPTPNPLNKVKGVCFVVCWGVLQTYNNKTK